MPACVTPPCPGGHATHKVDEQLVEHLGCQVRHYQVQPWVPQTGWGQHNSEAGVGAAEPRGGGKAHRQRWERLGLKAELGLPGNGGLWAGVGLTARGESSRALPCAACPNTCASQKASKATASEKCCRSSTCQALAQNNVRYRPLPPFAASQRPAHHRSSLSRTGRAPRPAWGCRWQLQNQWWQPTLNGTTAGERTECRHRSADRARQGAESCKEHHRLSTGQLYQRPNKQC